MKLCPVMLRSGLLFVCALAQSVAADDKTADTLEDCVSRFVAAIEAGDVEAVADQMSLKGDFPDGRLLFAMADAEVANGRLWKVARAQFGDEAALALARNTGNALPDHRDYLKLTATIDGDHATARPVIRDPRRAFAIWFVRVNGTWKLEFPGERPKFQDRTLGLIRRRTAAVEQLTSQIEKDEFHSADAAAKAFDRLAGHSYTDVQPKVYKPKRTTFPASQSATAPDNNAAPARLAADAATPSPKPVLDPDQHRILENPKTAIETAQAIVLVLNQSPIDPAVLTRFFYAKDDPDGKLARAVADRVVASMRFVAAYSTHFGEEPAPGEFAVVIPGDFFTLMLGDWKESPDGTAQYQPAEGNEKPEGLPVSMRKIEGRWKFDVTPINETVQEAIDAVTKHTAAVADARRALDAGRIKTADELKTALSHADIIGLRPPGPRRLPEIVPGR